MYITIGDNERIAYKTICKELNLSPIPEENFPSSLTVCATNGSAADSAWYSLCEMADAGSLQPQQHGKILLIDRENAAACIIRPDWLSGCPLCLKFKIKTVKETLGEVKNPKISLNLTVFLAIIFDLYHQLPIVSANFFSEQSWSLFAPAAQCPHCRSVKRSAVDFRKLYAPLSRIGKKRLSRQAANNGNSGLRCVSPEEFVSLNRAYIGFGSIIGNMIRIEEETLATLTGAPIFINAGEDYPEMAGGKGLSLEQSMASCLGEGLERYFLAQPFNNDSLIAAKEDLGNRACSPIAEFGFPAVDSHPSITPYTDKTVIEWVTAYEMTEGKEKLIPANMIYCPYVKIAGAACISRGSTNGVASGLNLEDATRQALLELIERDAFSFYARTQKPVLKISDAHIPPRILEYIKERADWADFGVTLLPSPFKMVYVVQVVMISRRSGTTETARGTGATLSLTASIERAFSECLQMFSSLSSTREEPAAELDMRHLWCSGEARNIFPNFFMPAEEMDYPPTVPQYADTEDLKLIIEAAKEQKLAIYQYNLCDSPSFCVARMLMTNLSGLDSAYYSGNTRFKQFAELMGIDQYHISYTGSLFM